MLEMMLKMNVIFVFKCCVPISSAHCESSANMRLAKHLGSMNLPMNLGGCGVVVMHPSIETNDVGWEGTPNRQAACCRRLHSRTVLTWTP